MKNLVHTVHTVHKIVTKKMMGYIFCIQNNTLLFAKKRFFKMKKICEVRDERGRCEASAFLCGVPARQLRLGLGAPTP